MNAINEIIECTDDKEEEGKMSTDANNMSLEELERYLHLKELSESDDSEMDNINSSSKCSGNECKENISNDNNYAIEHGKCDTKVEDNETLADEEFKENKNEEDDDLRITNVEVKRVKHKNDSLLYRLE